MLGLLGSIASAVLPRVFNTIDKAVPDKDLAATLKHDIQSTVLSIKADELKGARDIIVAEAKSESWITRSWRPITMLTFVAILINNLILVPWAATFGLPAPTLEVPEQLWGLLTVGLGGYIVSRGGEKIVTKWRDGPQS